MLCILDALVTLDALVGCTGDFLSNRIDAMLSSMITGTWTAFETLAGDL
jgi:hypothetical protein